MSVPQTLHSPPPKRGVFLSSFHSGRGSLSVVTFGGEGYRMLRLWALLIGLMVVAPALADQRVALVIGNDAYGSVPVLQKAAANARAMAASLSKLGFEVDSGVN